MSWRPTEPTGPTEPAAPDLSQLDLPAFPGRNIYFSQCGDNLLLLYVLPGLDSSQTAVVHVSLSQNKVLGTYDLGEGSFYVSATRKGFLAVNAETKKLLLYTDGSKREVDLPVSGTYPFVSLSRDGQTVISYDFDSAKIEQYSVTDGQVVRSEQLNIALWENIGMTDSAVYFSSSKGTYRFDRRSGQVKLAYDIAFYYMTDRYLIGQQGDYFAVQDVIRDKRQMYSSLTEGEAVLTDTPEYLFTQTSDGRLVRYDFAAGTCATAALDAETFCIDCAAFGDQVLISLIGDGEACLKTVTFGDAQPLTAQEWDRDTYEGVMQLPPVTGSDETVARINHIRDTYGVRVLYGPELFGMDGLSVAWKEITEQQILKTKCFDNIEKALQYFPDGMLREIGQGRDVVLYLCSDLESNGIDAAGNCIFMNRYAYIMLEYDWDEPSFVPMVIHEMFHACEYSIDYSVLSRWDEELPAEARAYSEVYGQEASSDYVYGFPGKKGVWYSSLYAKTNAKEDRAVTFEHLYDSFRYGFANEFEYAGMHQKAQLIADMLRATFESCRTADTLPWEKFL